MYIIRNNTHYLESDCDVYARSAYSVGANAFVEMFAQIYSVSFCGF
jgi:hypothetical protein